MKLKELAEVLSQTGDITFLEREAVTNVCITSLFLNGDGYLRLEQYQLLDHEDLAGSKEEPITEASIEKCLEGAKLWCLFAEEDEAIPTDDIPSDIQKLFKGDSLESLKDLPICDFYQPILTFLDGDQEYLAYRLG